MPYESVRWINNKKIYDFLCAEFTKEIPTSLKTEEKAIFYKLQNIIAEIFLITPKFAGLIYPSRFTHYDLDNIVLKPRFVDACLSVRRVEYLKIIGITKYDYTFQNLDMADEISPNGEIIWKGYGAVNWSFLEDSTYDWIYKRKDHRDKYEFTSQLDDMPITAFTNRDCVIEEIQNQAGELIPRSGKAALDFYKGEKKQISSMHFNQNKKIKLIKKPLN